MDPWARGNWPVEPGTDLEVQLLGSVGDGEDGQPKRNIQ